MDRESDAEADMLMVPGSLPAHAKVADMIERVKSTASEAVAQVPYRIQRHDRPSAAGRELESSESCQQPSTRRFE